MTRAKNLEQIQQAIKTLESFEEYTTEPFRIVILTLKQREKALKEKGVETD